MDLQITKQNQIQLKKFVDDVKKFIVANKLYVDIQGKNYVYVEGWQFMGGMLSIDAIPINLENLSVLAEKGEYKYSCTVELRNKEGTVIGRGYAICSNSEPKKKTFDEYAIASMAQTRAVGKAYRLKIGWMMKLAGYEGTPAEEATFEPDSVKATPDKKAAIIKAAKPKKETKPKVELKSDGNDPQSTTG